MIKDARWMRLPHASGNVEKQKSKPVCRKHKSSQPPAARILAPQKEAIQPARLTKNDFARIRRYENHKMRLRACRKYVFASSVASILLLPIVLHTILHTGQASHYYETMIRPDVLKFATNCVSNCLKVHSLS